jgi:hypothetical protein
VTGYTFEPWHYRYVGVAVATDMYTKGERTLEQYFNVTGGLYEGQDEPTSPPVTDPETPATPPEPAPPVPTPEAAASATKFIARIGSQVVVARLVVEGLVGLINGQITDFHISGTVMGWLTLAVAGGIIFWSQFGYKINAKFKWPF